MHDPILKNITSIRCGGCHESSFFNVASLNTTKNGSLSHEKYVLEVLRKAVCRRTSAEHHYDTQSAQLLELENRFRRNYAKLVTTANDLNEDRENQVYHKEYLERVRVRRLELLQKVDYSSLAYGMVESVIKDLVRLSTDPERLLRVPCLLRASLVHSVEEKDCLETIASQALIDAWICSNPPFKLQDLHYWNFVKYSRADNQLIQKYLCGGFLDDALNSLQAQHVTHHPTGSTYCEDLLKPYFPKSVAIVSTNSLDSPSYVAEQVIASFPEISYTCISFADWYMQPRATSNSPVIITDFPLSLVRECSGSLDLILVVDPTRQSVETRFCDLLQRRRDNACSIGQETIISQSLLDCGTIPWGDVTVPSLRFIELSNVNASYSFDADANVFHSRCFGNEISCESLMDFWSRLLAKRGSETNIKPSVAPLGEDCASEHKQALTTAFMNFLITVDRNWETLIERIAELESQYMQRRISAAQNIFKVLPLTDLVSQIQEELTKVADILPIQAARVSRVKIEKLRHYCA